MSEITATEKRGNGKNGNRKNEQRKIGQPENSAIKWAGRKKGQHKVIVRKYCHFCRCPISVSLFTVAVFAVNLLDNSRQKT